MKSPWLLITISLMAIIMTLGILVFPTAFGWLNNRLSYLEQVSGYLGMFFAAVALLVASLAYNSANLRPNLKLNIYPYMGNKNEVKLLIKPNSNVVPNIRAYTEWYFELENIGKATARYPAVQIVFDEAYFDEDSFPGWMPTHHANAVGFFGYQWSPPNNYPMVHPGFPIKLPAMYFTNKPITMPLKVKISIVADGFKKEYECPVEFEIIDDLLE